VPATLVSILRAVGLSVGLLAAVYVPTFVIVSLHKASLDVAVALICGLSVLIALALMTVLGASAHYTSAEFGFRWPDRKSVAWAVFAGIPTALAAAWLDQRFGSAGPLAGLTLSLPAALAFFGVCAPVQEEIIFRGLVQTVAARNCVGDVMFAGVRISYAALIAAALFGLVHLEVAVFTAVTAFGLGVFAGELRKRSGSLLPPVVLHALFNAASFLFVSAHR
jgi:membrane protease YdiL (CAAX protease family)